MRNLTDIIILILLFCALLIGLTFLYLLLTRKISVTKWIRKRRLNLVFEHKDIETIHFNKQKLTDTNTDFPINRQEINEFLRKAHTIFPGCLLGIEKISLIEKPSHYSKSCYGSYMKFDSYKSKNGSSIWLYPLEKAGDHYKLYFNITSFRFRNLLRRKVNHEKYRQYYILLDETEAKAELLHTLGHELGHSIIYNTEKRLYGNRIEKRCDQWAINLGATSILLNEELLHKKMIYHNGSPIGLGAELDEIRAIIRSTVS